MRVFITVLFLIFSLHSWTKADDIRDFQIEGMSLGDSLLDYYSENEINNADIIYYPNSRKFYQIAFMIESETYDGLNINLKKNDKKYIIYSIKGLKNYDNRLDECLEQKKKIINQILSIIKNTEEVKFESSFANNFGKSIAYVSEFKFDNGSFNIGCSKWDKKNEKVISNKWWDSLNTDMAVKEWRDWLNNEAY